MGCVGILSSSSHDVEYVYVPTKNWTVGNPNPKSFKLLEHKEIGNWLIVKVHYPDAKNYEGTKIMVYKDITYRTFCTWNVVDPHFSANAPEKSPFIRFKPTDEGWKMAEDFVKFMNR